MVKTPEVDRAESRLLHFFNFQGFVSLLAESENEILGFVAGNSEPFRLYDIFYLREICIKSELQRSGIGRMLYTK